MTSLSYGSHLDPLAAMGFGFGLLWMLTEAKVFFMQRSRRTGAQQQDRGSLYLIIVPAILGIGYACLDVWLFRYEPMAYGLRVLGPMLFAGGLGLRQWSITVLGRFFTVDVAIHGEHRLIEDGPYRRLRHPSYTGFAMILLGLALMVGKPLALVLMLVPPLPGLIRRIQVEEAALRQAFGDSFTAYAKRTWRLIPGLF